VTEETTGVDIVIEQLRIANGQPLSVTETPEPRGHAFEFRINAEDPGRGFLPTPGLITRFRAPAGPGVRIDAGVETGSEIPGFYDSMMAKLIVTGATREEALIRARRALAEFRIEGVASVLPFHRAVLDERDFTGEDGFGVFTNWIETEFRGLEPSPRVDPAGSGLIRSFVEIDGKRHAIGLPAALFSGLGAPQLVQQATSVSDGGVTAPIPGTLQQWLVDDGAEVAEGDAVAVIEAMKMETRILAPKAGRIRIKTEAGAVVSLGAELATVG
jgi:acetyl-CoA/propionyl-CoA carboxylase biotin carboxyl carrier protein